MPELPEVETVRRGLSPYMTGAQIMRAEARRPDLRFALPQGFAKRLTGARVEILQRRAKYLLARLSTGESLLMHLGMSGRFTIEPAQAAAARPGGFVRAPGTNGAHDHVIFDMAGGRAGDARIVFNDPRRFGFMTLFDTGREAEAPFLNGLGPEPLGNNFSAAGLWAALKARRAPVKALLLDQRVVAGLGNIYVCEALHRAHVSPLREGHTLSEDEAGRLFLAIRLVLEEAIEAGGSSLKDFAAADGGLGYFQHAFRVYGREGQPCPDEDCSGVIARHVQSGRSSFLCPVCQL